uniref:Fructose-1,6-bisphosphate aldolase/phosphatase n=1 Tax=uncultured organism TaxID=155900 RepID=M1PP21_9ZZZZ|nr:fructose-1,6-bisphosphatase [uncultured organism]
MKITLSVIKADIGSVGGHITPSSEVLREVEDFISTEGSGLVIDHHIAHTGDDISILLTHQQGEDSAEIHQLGWDAFQAGTKVAESEGLYGAGQDLLSDAFSGNVKGLGPAVAELSFEERPSEPFLFFMADKTEPGAYNLPFYLSYADPMYNPGLMLSPKMEEGFVFTVMDVENTENDRVIELTVPEDIYDLACLLRDNGRFVVESIRSAKTGEPTVSCSTTRLNKIAGEYVGKDDPVALARVQKNFPATGELLAPYSIGHYVAGFMRGSHNGPLMPVTEDGTISYFDGPPVVSCLAFSLSDGELTEPVDVFDHPFWDQVRQKVSRKAVELREQGFSGPAMLDYKELEYGGITKRMDDLDEDFEIREE